MKVTLKIFTLLSLGFCFTQCSEQKGPEDVMKEWLEYKSAGQCEKALDLETEVVPRRYKETDCEPYPLSIKDINCEIEGESAICGCYETRGNQDTQEYYYSLKYTDGEWKIHEEL